MDISRRMFMASAAAVVAATALPAALAKPAPIFDFDFAASRYTVSWWQKAGDGGWKFISKTMDSYEEAVAELPTALPCFGPAKHAHMFAQIEQGTFVTEYIPTTTSEHNVIV